MTQPKKPRPNDQPTTAPRGGDSRADQVLTITNPEDLLAAMPLLFGFIPEDSVVMMTMGGRRPFHARADIPEIADAQGLTDSLVHALRRHDCRKIALIVVTSNASRARLLLTALRAMFASAEVDVLADVATDGARWWAGDDLDPQSPGTDYDVTGHRFRAEAVLRGQDVSRSRRDIAALVARGSVSERLDAELERALSQPSLNDAADHRQPRLREQISAAVLAEATPSDSDLAQILVALESAEFIEALRADLTRAQGSRQAHWWAAVARRSPDPWGAHAAALAAMAAWLSGDGALAWCAVDRARAGVPDHPLAALVAALIESAQAPQDWDGERWKSRSA